MKVLFIFIGLLGTLAACGTAAACPADADFRWINAVGPEAGALELTINTKPFHQAVVGPQVTAAAKVTLGRQTVVVAGPGGVSERFDWEVERPEHALLVTAPLAGGGMQTRVLAGVKWGRGERGARVFNATGGGMLELTSGKQLVRVRPGREVVVRAEREILGALVREGGAARGFKIVLPEKPGHWEVVVLLRSVNQPEFLFVRESDGAVGASWAVEAAPQDWPAVAVEAPVEKAAAVGFDPAAVDWSKVKSRVCWFNGYQTREGLNFACNGTVVFQREPSGALSGFVKWPAGKWEISVSGLRSGELGKFPLVVGERAKVFVLTTGAKGQALRSLVMASDLKAPVRLARVRVVNGFPAGTLRQAAGPDAPRPSAITPAECGAVLPTEDGWFGGATYAHSGGLQVVLPRSRLPVGDWLAVCHLDHETGASALVTWVEIGSGRVVEPGEPLASPEAAEP